MLHLQMSLGTIRLKYEHFFLIRSVGQNERVFATLFDETLQALTLATTVFSR